MREKAAWMIASNASKQHATTCIANVAKCGAQAMVAFFASLGALPYVLAVLLLASHDREKLLPLTIIAFACFL